MTFEFREDVLCLSGTVTVDEAESLLQQLQGRAGIEADLSACEHIHAASLQVLLAARIRIQSWPRQAQLADWLQAAFH
jgi:ABC-type transporter Mla MlaB component